MALTDDSRLRIAGEGGVELIFQAMKSFSTHPILLTKANATIWNLSEHPDMKRLIAEVCAALVLHTTRFVLLSCCILSHWRSVQPSWQECDDRRELLANRQQFVGNRWLCGGAASTDRHSCSIASCLGP